MTKGETSSTFKSASEMTTDESRSFDRWMINNAVIGSIVAAGIVAIIVIGPTRPSYLSSPNAAAATDVSAVAKAD